MTTAAKQRLEIESYSNLLSVEKGLTREIEVFRTTLSMNEETICSTVSVGPAPVAPKTKESPVVDNNTQGSEIHAGREQKHAEDRQMERRMRLLRVQNNLRIA